MHYKHLEETLRGSTSVPSRSSPASLAKLRILPVESPLLENFVETTGGKKKSLTTSLQLKSSSPPCVLLPQKNEWLKHLWHLVLDLQAGSFRWKPRSAPASCYKHLCAVEQKHEKKQVAFHVSQGRDHDVSPLTPKSAEKTTLDSVHLQNALDLFQGELSFTTCLQALSPSTRAFWASILCWCIRSTQCSAFISDMFWCWLQLFQRRMIK